MMDVEDMLAAHEAAELERRWETAYWVSNLMSVSTKRPVKAENLMKPFLPKKDHAAISDERQKFFDDFKKQRKEALGKWEQ